MGLSIDYLNHLLQMSTEYAKKDEMQHSSQELINEKGQHQKVYMGATLKYLSKSKVFKIKVIIKYWVFLTTDAQIYFIDLNSYQKDIAR